MTETQMLTLAGMLVATLFGVLVAVLGWLGNKFYTKLDEISSNLVKMAGELHERINGLDRRTTVLETKIEGRREQ